MFAFLLIVLYTINFSKLFTLLVILLLNFEFF